MTDRGPRVAELIAKWREEAARHQKHGDCYRVGQGWGLAQCADELEAALTDAERRPPEEKASTD